MWSRFLKHNQSGGSQKTSPSEALSFSVALQKWACGLQSVWAHSTKNSQTHVSSQSRKEISRANCTMHMGENRDKLFSSILLPLRHISMLILCAWDIYKNQKFKCGKSVLLYSYIQLNLRRFLFFIVSYCATIGHGTLFSILIKNGIIIVLWKPLMANQIYSRQFKGSLCHKTQTVCIHIHSTMTQTSRSNNSEYCSCVVIIYCQANYLADANQII